METDHLLSLGATLVERKKFLLLLEESLKKETIQGNWH
jgi:Leu/Phe-tRNA-protein transferase